MLKLIFALLLPMSVFSQIPPIESGVSQTLAKWRAAHYSDVRYKLDLLLEKQAPLMKGNIEIRVTLDDVGASNPLVLDWRTTQFQNDKDKPYANVIGVNDALDIVSQENNEHILIPNGLLKKGENVIKITFASPLKTSGSAITRYIDKEDGSEYIYSLFVPSDASTAFPVFDQPDLKARFTLNVLAPHDWKVISNSATEEFSVKALVNNPRSYEDKQEIDQNKRWVRFLETKPISTYVFAYAAGEFAEVSEPTADGSDLLTKIYVRKSQSEKFKQHSAKVFRLNREGVKFLEDYFDYKFPFPKYDLVLIPEFPFGGMEHAGATFLRESSVIFPTEPTKNDHISRANLIFHEAAHQWFGDTVTMKWFDDLWLKEGFAEFMAYKTLEKVMPEYNAWKIFYERNKQAAYLTDSTKGTTPIYQEIQNLSSAKSAYGNIVYRKAPSFLKQAEFYFASNKFQTAVRAFLKKHEFANAKWQDLVNEFEGVVCFGNRSMTYSEDANGQRIREMQCLDKSKKKTDLSKWADSWVKKRGVPIIRVKYLGAKVSDLFIRLPSEEVYQKEFKVLQGNSVEENSLLEQEFDVRLKYKKGNSSLGVSVKSNEKTAILRVSELAAIDATSHNNTDSPVFIFPNYQDYGYGIFLLDGKSRAYVLENIQNEKDDFLRSMMWGSLWDSVRFYELAPEDYVELVIKNLNVETDESTIQTLLGRTSTALNSYIQNGDTTDKLRIQLENLLIDKIKTAPTVGQKITFYRAFLNIAASENARVFLKMLLNGNAVIPDGTDVGKMPVFRTKDKFDIVTRLIILNDADALKLLENLEKTETSDDAKRYAYAARAGIPTPENKAKYWNDFVNNKEISESWIEAAFAVFNTPRHAELTAPYLEKALAELPNLKKNRKIFFVNGWLGSFIGGQRSQESLDVTNKFLAANPNLDKDLRLKILENADGIERAVKIRNKYR